VCGRLCQLETKSDVPETKALAMLEAVLLHPLIIHPYAVRAAGVHQQVAGIHPPDLCMLPGYRLVSDHDVCVVRATESDHLGIEDGLCTADLGANALLHSEPEPVGAAVIGAQRFGQSYSLIR
jgi:hypothetical protein